MKTKLKEIFENSFYYLLVIYIVIVILISLSLLYKYTLHFEILALILAILGISLFFHSKHEEDTPEKDIKAKKHNHLYYSLFILALIIIFLIRFIPYINNSIPLGYDTGIYKYAIEHGLTSLDNWILNAFEPGFLYLMKPISIIFSIDFILIYLLIGFSLLLGIAVYLVALEFSNHNKKTALIALFIYSLSTIQFLTFSYMYYKNVIALSLALFSILFIEKYGKNKNKLNIILFILFAVLTGIIHRPTFYILGLSYFFYAFTSPYKNKKYDFKSMSYNVLYGVIIIIFTGIFYLGKFSQAILNILPGVAQGFLQPGEAGGTFINFTNYQFSILFYLAFAILGFFLLIYRKKFNMLFFWTLISGIIIFFQFFFFNRFIIHLDIMLIILASAGFSLIIENKKKFRAIILIILLISAGYIIFNESINSKPLIGDSELKTIEYLKNTENNSYVMSTSSFYSPWVLGYSQRKTIAPGLFDYNTHNKAEWMEFWTTNNSDYMKDFMDNYEKPLYLFIGIQQNDNLKRFPECFSIFYEQEGNKIYKYVC